MDFVVLVPESPGNPQKALSDRDSVLFGQEGKVPGRQEEAAQELPRAPDHSPSWAARPGTLGCCPLRRVLPCLPPRPPLPVLRPWSPPHRCSPTPTAPWSSGGDRTWGHPSKEAPLSWPGEDLTGGPQICLPRGIYEPVPWVGQPQYLLFAAVHFSNHKVLLIGKSKTHIVLNLRLIIDNISKEVISLILICF